MCLKNAVPVFILLFLCSCFLFRKEPVLEKWKEESIEKAADVTPRMRKRAASFKKKVAVKCSECGVYLTDEAYRLYKDRFGKLAARCAMLGINTVYMSVDFDNLNSYEYAARTRNRLFILHKRNIKCRAVLRGVGFFKEPELIRKTVYSYKKFNENSEDAQTCFDGVCSAVEPHSVTKENENLMPVGLLFKWTENSYGPGRDNCMLVGKLFEMLELFKKYAPDVPISQSVEASYHKKAVNGELLKGTVNDFLKYCDTLIVQSYYNDRRDIYEAALDSLKASLTPKSIVICVKTVTNRNLDEIREKSLSSKSFYKITRDMEYIVRKAAKSPSFKGVAFFNYTGLENDWSEK